MNTENPGCRSCFLQQSLSTCWQWYSAFRTNVT